MVGQGAKARFKRHDLVGIAPCARRSLDVQPIGAEGFWPDEEVDRLARNGYDGVFPPGIVARQPQGAAGLVVGLSAPYRKDGMRLRAYADLPPDCVVSVRSPYQVAASLAQPTVPDLPVFQAAREVVGVARRFGLACGVFGSCALELETGLPYCHEASDLDFVVELADRETLSAFSEAVGAIGQRCSVAADGEVELPGGWGVKLAELLDDGSTVLTKGFNDVRLIEKEEAYAMNHSQSFERKENRNGSQV
jgi:phosphoribosyl-dephospho-CoA transferase